MEAARFAASHSIDSFDDEDESESCERYGASDSECGVSGARCSDASSPPPPPLPAAAAGGAFHAGWKLELELELEVEWELELEGCSQ